LIFICITISLTWFITFVALTTTDRTTPVRHQAGLDFIFPLNLDRFEQILPGYACLYIKNEENSATKMSFDYFEIIKQVGDPRDIISTNGAKPNVSAELISDGSGVIISEPMIPTYWVNNIKQVCKGDEFARNKKVDYIDKLAKYRESAPKLRKTRLIFPQGVVGSTEHIGGRDSAISKGTELQLFTNFFKAPLRINENEANFLTYYAYWKIGVKGSAKKVEFEHDIEEEDIAKTILGLSGLGILKSTSNRMDDSDAEN
jgi:hypothetical protein